MQLTCDDCGSVQPEGNVRCELCSASLREEAQRKEEGSLIGLALASIVSTAIFCLAPGVVIKLVYFPDLAEGTFIAVYGAAWVIGGLLYNWYSPLDSYDFGWRVRGYGFVDNPFSLRDDAHRTHAAIGFALFPIAIVTGLWLAVARRVLGLNR